MIAISPQPQSPTDLDFSWHDERLKRGAVNEGVPLNALNPLQALSLDQLRQRTSAKWRRFPPDVLPLWVADMDFPSPPPVVRALQERDDAADQRPAADEVGHWPPPRCCSCCCCDCWW